jgi:hypothetical protein
MKRALNQVSFHQLLVLDHIKLTGFYSNMERSDGVSFSTILNFSAISFMV